jgi:hypothetical protein
MPPLPIVDRLVSYPDALDSTQMVQGLAPVQQPSDVCKEDGEPRHGAGIAGLPGLMGIGARRVRNPFRWLGFGASYTIEGRAMRL